MKYQLILLFLISLINWNCLNQAGKSTNESASNDKVLQNLKNWLAKPGNERPTLEQSEFSKQKLSKSQAIAATQLIYQDQQSSFRNKYNQQWEDRMISFQDFKMPFYYKTFGKKPLDGRSLFISLHGGGGTTAEVNNQQYENQKHLYDETMEKMEGIYLAPRAPTNTWNLWHQGHIDEFINILIQMAIIKEEVNPNKIYLLGYSAGGDGVYQLAPRMADRFAAASMMAGHPNDASPLGLRNLPFAIHMGALDSAYDRNKVAEQWGKTLDELEASDPGAYKHEIQLHEGLGHWMKLQDKIAIPWMAKNRRNPIPQKVVWKQSGRHHSTFYWLKTPADLIETNGEIRVSYDPVLNEINIEENYGKILQLFLNDDMLNLDKAITIRYKNNIIYQGIFKRSILNIKKNISYKGDLNFAFPCSISIKDNQTVLEN